MAGQEKILKSQLYTISCVKFGRELTFENFDQLLEAFSPTALQK